MSEESSPLLDLYYGYGSNNIATRGANDGDNDEFIMPRSPPSSSSPPPAICIDNHRRSSIAAMAAAADILSARRESQVLFHSQNSTTNTNASLLRSRKSINHHAATEMMGMMVPKQASNDMDFEPLACIQDEEENYPTIIDIEKKKENKSKELTATTTTTTTTSFFQLLRQIISQIPAIAIASLLNFMIGIPFGASYFPTELQLPMKEVLGLRMFLFSTAIAQLVFTFYSKFHSATGLQMVENVPFCLALARIVMEEEGNSSGSGGEEDSRVLSTLFFLFGLSSILVGLVFYLLGKFEMGRIVYFFPSHVLVGCIGGIGAYIVVTALQVTTNTTCSLTLDGLHECVVQHIQLLWPVLAFEAFLRLLMKITEKKSNGDAQYPLLCPIYYCCITPVFYLGLQWIGVSKESAERDGYFFPPLSATGSVFNRDLFDIFTKVHPRCISWSAVARSIPTMISLTAFSLIHVPINIPAFAISSNVDPDMNAELIAHGISNAAAGVFGGIQNYMAYSNSVIYSKSNGKGKWSSLAIVAISILVFIYGPMMASYVPRCMAGTLLLHVGIDLFLEGAIDSYKDYDKLEYSGILLIMIVMVSFGMDAALVAGVVAALSTFLAQSIVYQDPIRGAISGARLQSSAWNRSTEAQQILLDPEKGRQRIYVIQLQGHIFFGNVVKMTEDVKRRMNDKRRACDEPAVVILDFSHVLGMDSSAAQSIAKLKSFLLKNFDEVEIILFVTGYEDGFRCTYNLSEKVTDKSLRTSIRIVEGQQSTRHDHRLSLAAGALPNYIDSKSKIIAEIPGCRICATIDDALIFAEDVLIALENPGILKRDCNERFPLIRKTSQNVDEVMSVFETLCPDASHDEISTLVSMLTSEKYHAGDILWREGDASDSLKVVISGTLISLLEDDNGSTERINAGSVIGELGLVNMSQRLTTVKVLSDEATLYSLSRENWETMTQEYPKVARYIDLLVIRYLSHRVQHASTILFDRHFFPV